MPHLEQLSREHESALRDFELVNREYFSRTISDRGDDFFTRFSEHLQARVDEQAAGEGAYFVIVDDQRRLVGRINVILDGETGVLGFRVAEAAAGQGLATWAVGAVRRPVSELGLRMLVASASTANLASQRVLERSGFSRVGPADPRDVGGKQGVRFELVL